MADLVLRLAALGCWRDCSFEVFNGDCLQMPLLRVAQRARASAQWLGEDCAARYHCPTACA